jgi:D-tyrosyl-tRNA(Tyr) deacylase
VDGKVEGEIAGGVCVLLGVTHEDGPEQVRWLAGKVANLRVFEDEAGKLNRSLLDVCGSALVVSQFSVSGECGTGIRHSFLGAAEAEKARQLYEDFSSLLAGAGVSVSTGVFQAHMQVELCNDGPVTLILDTPEV